MGELKAITVDKFLGVNKSVTETQLQPGEAANMSNFIITDDYKISKMFGYVHLFDTLGSHGITGMWYGAILGVFHFIFSCNGHVYEHNLTTHVNTDLGSIADANPTIIFSNNNTVYIKDQTEYYKWTGTGSISLVVGYTPVVATASAPTGGGTLLEAINLISGKKTQKFSGNNSATVYQLLETNIDSVNTVKVNGVTLTVGTNYTVNLTNGTITFVTAPTTGVNNVEITWTKVAAGDRTSITNCKYYGGVYYSRLWFYGNPNYKNTRYPTGVTINGVSDPEYFPKFGDSDVGEYEITDIITQYDKQLIFTSSDSSGAAAWYSTSEIYTDPNSGVVSTLFPVFPLNAKIGNIAKGQVQTILNNPFTIWKGVYEWSSATGVVDEKNAAWKSKRVQSDLDSVDLSKAITVDWDDKGLYWLCVGKKVWVYNYRIDVWYILDLDDTPTCFLIADGKLYFGTDSGQIMQFDESLIDYDGTIIDSEWEMGFYNFGVEWLRKFIQRMFISLKPEVKSRVDFTYETDKGDTSDTLTAEYSLIDFDDIDFDDFSFDCSYNPQPFKFKIRAKKIDYFKLKLISNFEGYNATVLSITLPTRIGGEVKGR